MLEITELFVHENEMPESCAECPLRTTQYDELEWWCCITYDEVGVSNVFDFGRPSSCPLRILNQPESVHSDETPERGIIKEVSVSLWEIDTTSLAKIAKEKPHTQILVHSRRFGFNQVLAAWIANALRAKEDYVCFLFEDFAKL